MTSTSVLDRILLAGPGRKSRLHDAMGYPIPVGRFLRNGPAAFATGIARLAFDSRPDLPWISYDARRHIAGRLRKDARILEFGSGMSTAWWAAHAREVIAIESYAPWHDIVVERFRERGIANAKIRLAPTESQYLTIAEEERGAGFDLVIIDGLHRARCVDVALEHIRPGGMIYLDNSDVEDEAREKLAALGAAAGGTLETFTDLAPTTLFVQQGLLCSLPS